MKCDFFHFMLNFLLKRQLKESDELIRRSTHKTMENINPFDVTAIGPFVSNFHLKTLHNEDAEAFNNDPTTTPLRQKDISERIFLPFPKTWIEFEFGKPVTDDRGVVFTHLAYLLCESNSEDSFSVHILEWTLETDPVKGERRGFWSKTKDAISVKKIQEVPEPVTITLLRCFLYVVNSPTIINNQQHSISFTARRKLIRSSGKFPLKAYHTITLKPGAEIPEIRFENCGGWRNPQHEVRQHIRYYKRTGKTVLIKSHIRGDPSLGIKRARYIVEPPTTMR